MTRKSSTLFLSPPTQLIHPSLKKICGCLDLNPIHPRTTLSSSWRRSSARLNDSLFSFNGNRGPKYTGSSPSFTTACSITPVPFRPSSRHPNNPFAPPLPLLPLYVLKFPVSLVYIMVSPLAKPLFKGHVTPFFSLLSLLLAIITLSFYFPAFPSLSPSPITCPASPLPPQSLVLCYLDGGKKEEGPLPPNLRFGGSVPRSIMSSSSSSLMLLSFRVVCV